MKKIADTKNERKYLFLALLITSLLVFVGLVLNQLGDKSSSVKQSTLVNSQPDPTANWKTFTDANNSFEFKYPNTNYQISPDANNVIEMIDYPNKGSVVNPTLKVDFLPNNDSELEKIADKIKSCEPGMGCKVLTKNIFGNNFFISFVGPSYVTESQYFIKLSSDGKNYVQFVFIAFEENTRDQILSTFKFIN